MTNDGGLCQAQRRFHKSEWEYQSTGEGCECHWLAWIKWLRVLCLGCWQGTSQFVLSIRIDHNHNNLSRALYIRVFVDSNRNVTGAFCWCSMALSDLYWTQVTLPGAGQRVFELLDLKPDICEAGPLGPQQALTLCWLRVWSGCNSGLGEDRILFVLITSLGSAEDIGDPFPEQSKEVRRRRTTDTDHFCHTRKLLLQTSMSRLHYQIPQVFSNADHGAAHKP